MLESILELEINSQYEKLLKLPLYSLINLCQNDVYCEQISNTQQFWKHKSIFDYGDRAYYNPNTLDWKELYYELFNSEDFPICVNEVDKGAPYSIIYNNISTYNNITKRSYSFNDCMIIGYLRVFKDETLKSVMHNIEKIYGDYLIRFIDYDGNPIISNLDVPLVSDHPILNYWNDLLYIRINKTKPRYSNVISRNNLASSRNSEILSSILPSSQANFYHITKLNHSNCTDIYIYK